MRVTWGALVLGSSPRPRVTAGVLWPAEVLYEDLQYLSVSAVALAGIAGLLMLAMWLLDKAYKRIVAWRRKKQLEGKAERR